MDKLDDVVSVEENRMTDHHHHHHHHHNDNNNNQEHQNEQQSSQNNQNKHHHQNQRRRFSLFTNSKVTPAKIITHEQKSFHNVVFDQLLQMIEPIEFYTVRAKAAPKAPSLIRITIAVLFLLGSIVVFSIVVHGELNSYSVETDIFRKLPNLNEWDDCEPITTLGSNWTPFSLYVIDDTSFKQVRFNLHNYWFKNRTVCEETIGPTWKKFCTLESNGGFFHSIANNTFSVVSCNGKPLDWINRKTAADCEKNHMELWIKYWNPTTGDPFKDCYGSDLKQGYIDMCSAIFDSTNPYKCLKKNYNTVIDSLSNGYAFATLAFTCAVVGVTTIFPLLFTERGEVEIEA